MRLIFLAIAIIAGCAACNKKRLNVTSFWECNQAQNLDTTAIADKLLGSWIWDKQSCFWTGKTTAADKNIKVIFRKDHSFSIIENANVSIEGIWKIKVEDSLYWGLELSEQSEYLYGRILFCDNQVLFNYSYIDGCDNVFTQQE